MSARDELADTIRDEFSRWTGTGVDLDQDVELAADAVVAAGWRPPARTVTTVEEIEALLDGTVLLTPNGIPWERWGDEWMRPGEWSDHDSESLVEIFATLTVVYAPNPTEPTS